ncbi:helix-turn-helix transcriptional regulator, partial [Klebsiella pneumoniae]|uniref:helix-turn-helix transcriptional regulator n=2 Tax=Pseudomonadota TaxID=1224 RepID=UPI0034D68872
WHLTDSGNGQFPDNHAALTADILASISAVFGDAGLDKLIAHREATTLDHYRRELADAGSLEQRVQHLADIRSAEGYMAETTRDAAGALVLV